MMISRVPTPPLFFAIAILLATNTYFASRCLDPNSPAPMQLTTNKVVELVDERLARLERKKTEDAFSKVVDSYHQAQARVPKGQLLYGNPTARITLLEFADIECPYCRRMQPGIKQVVEHSSGTINWEFKHFPLSMHNPAAAVESQAVECIKSNYDNRVAWAVLDSLMLDTNGNGKGVGDIPEYIRSLGLNGTLIKHCLNSDAHKDKINGDYEDGRRLGITSTPAVKILDNKTGRSRVIRGFKTADQLLQEIQSVM